MGKVRVARADGELGTIDESELQRALDSGFRVVDDGEAEAIKDRREVDSAGSTALAAVEAGAAGASLGATSYLAGKVLGDDYAEGARKRRDANSSIALGAEALGGVAATIGTGGGALAARAGAGAARLGAAGKVAGLLGKAVAAPSRYAARAGTAAGGAIGRAAGGGVAGRVLGGAVGGAIEGGAAGVGTAIHESVLGGREITAERLVGGFVAGSAFGGAIGGGLPLSAAVARRAVDAPVSAVQKVLGKHLGKESGQISPDLARAVRDGDGFFESSYRKVASLDGSDVGTAGRVGKALDTDSKLAHRYLSNKASIEAESVALIQKEMPTVLKSTEVLEEAIASGSRKYDNIKGGMPRNADVVAPRYAVQAVKEIKGKVDEMLETNALTGQASFDLPMLQKVDAMLKRTVHEMGPNTAAASHAALNRTRQDIGKMVRKLGGWDPKPGLFLRDSKVSSLVEALEPFYHSLNKHLSDESLYGATGKAHASMNDAFSSLFRAEDAFKASGATGIRKVLDGAGEVNAKEAMHITRQYGRSGGDEAVSSLQEAMRSRIAVIKEARKHYRFKPEHDARLAAAEKSLANFEKRMAENSKGAEFLSDVGSLRNVEGGGSPSITTMTNLGPPMLSALGMGVGGPLGAAAGMGIGMLTKPYWRTRMIAGLMSMSDGVSGKLGSGIGPMLKRLKGAGKKAGAAASRAATATGKASAPAAARLGMSRKERKERASKATEFSYALASSPDYLEKTMAPHLDGIQDVAPELASEMSALTQRAATFLASKVPQTYTEPFSGLPPMVDPVGAEKFARYVEAVKDPVDVLSRLDSGGLTVEHVEAVREVYPQMYEETRRQVVDAMLDAEANGRSVPYNDRVRIAVLLDVPTVQGLTAESLQRTQAIYTQAAVEESAAAAPQAQGTAAGPVRAQGATSMDVSRHMSGAAKVASGIGRG